MKILLIDVNYKHSSTGKIVYDLHVLLTEQGHSSLACYGRGPLVREAGVHRISGVAEVYFHALMTRLTGLTGCFSPLATRKLLRIMEEFQPDVVHIHDIVAYFANIAPVVEYLKRNAVPTVWTLHSEFLYTGKCGHAFECERWLSGCGQCPQKRVYPASWFFDRTARMFEEKRRLFGDFERLFLTTPSCWLAERVKRSFLGTKPLRVVRNGIDTTNIFFPRTPAQLRERFDVGDKKVLLAVAPNLMSEDKGGRWVVELAERMRSTNSLFFLIGVDDLSERFPPNVHAIGRTKDQRELATFYSMADLTILTSKRETFSLVCAESLCCGTPVAGFDSGAPSEVAPPPYGIFVPYGDLNSLADAVEGALRRGTLTSKEECATFGAARYSKERMGSEYVALYEKMLSERRRRTL